MRKFILLLFSLLTYIGVNAQNNGTFYFSNLNLKDGLSQISVIKILQDSKGFMWFATRNGLNRYDGSEFLVYKHTPGDSLSLSDNNIISLVEDHNHNLWIGTARGLNKLDLTTNQIKQYTDKQYGALAKADIRSLFVDSRSRLWVGTTNGLYLYVREMDVFQRIDLNGRIKDEFIAIIYETKEHLILIGTANKGLYVCDMNMKVQRHFSTTTSKVRLPNNNVSTLYEDSKGYLWGGEQYLRLVQNRYG